EIRDLPWVCGGCSDERGFSEGSQPLGIFRPVTLIISNPVKVEPFGVHAWNDTTVNKSNSTVHLSAEIKNYQNKAGNFTLEQQFLTRDGRLMKSVRQKVSLKAGQSKTLKQSFEN